MENRENLIDFIDSTDEETSDPWILNKVNLEEGELLNELIVLNITQPKRRLAKR